MRGRPFLLRLAMMQLPEGELCTWPATRVTPKNFKVITFRGEKWSAADRWMSLPKGLRWNECNSKMHLTAEQHVTIFDFRMHSNLKQDTPANEYAVERV